MPEKIRIEKNIADLFVKKTFGEDKTVYVSLPYKNIDYIECDSLNGIYFFLPFKDSNAPERLNFFEVVEGNVESNMVPETMIQPVTVELLKRFSNKIIVNRRVNAIAKQKI
jgi:hypothetical protein